MSSLNEDMAWCNYCQEFSYSQFNDCVNCKLSKPTGAMMQSEIDKLKAELAKLQESHDLLMAMNHDRMEENAALKELVREADVLLTDIGCYIVAPEQFKDLLPELNERVVEFKAKKLTGDE